jgi:hypothetical protein
MIHLVVLLADIYTNLYFIFFYRVMLTCALRAQDKEPKNGNIPSNFVHSIYYKFKNSIECTHSNKKLLLPPVTNISKNSFFRFIQ